MGKTVAVVQMNQTKGHLWCADGGAASGFLRMIRRRRTWVLDEPNTPSSVGGGRNCVDRLLAVFDGRTSHFRCEMWEWQTCR